MKSVKRNAGTSALRTYGVGYTRRMICENGNSEEKKYLILNVPCCIIIPAEAFRVKSRSIVAICSLAVALLCNEKRLK